MRILSTLFVLSSLSFLSNSSAMARPVSATSVPLTICLTNEAGVPLKAVIEVEARVAAIFKESAIELRWINAVSHSESSLSPISCGSLSYPSQLMIHWIPKARTAPLSVLGETFLDENDAGVIADLFLDHVRAVEAETKVGFVNLLSCATAHEIGHLLLGANSHSRRGIMQGHFYGQNLAAIRQGALAFETSEEERMHFKVQGTPGRSGLAAARQPAFSSSTMGKVWRGLEQ